MRAAGKRSQSEARPSSGHAANTKGGASTWRGHIIGAGLMLVATLLGLMLVPVTAPLNLLWLYALGALGTAVFAGLYPAVFAAVLGVILFELLFAPPLSTLRVGGGEYLIPLGSLIAVAALLGVLAIRAHQRELAARTREARALALFDASKQLTAVSGSDQIAGAAVHLVRQITGREAALYLPDGGLAAATPTFHSGAEVAEALPRFNQRIPEGRGAEPGSIALVPVQAAGAPLGVLVIEAHTAVLSADELVLLRSFAALTALALERANLAAAARQTRLLEETERLQTALLNSISHDLRTPLATIAGSLSSLLEDEALLRPAARHELAQTAWEEAIRLNQIVGNLLDMTRLQAGALHIAPQPVDVDELVGAAVAQMARRLEERQILRDIPPELPPVSIDLVFMVQALVNLLDNAHKYSPRGVAIEIAARLRGVDKVELAVRDRGPGLPPGDSARLFDKFTRGREAAGAGSGLGLAISRGIIEAHDGRLHAANRPGGGAEFTIELAVAVEDGDS